MTIWQKRFLVYQRNACKSIFNDRGRVGFGENGLCDQKTLCRTRPAHHASRSVVKVDPPYRQTGCSFPRNFANFRRNVGILIGSLL